MATKTYAQVERNARKVRRQEIRSLGRKPAKIQRIYRVTTEVIAIPSWAYEQRVPELESTGDYIWLKSKQLVNLLVKMDRGEGGRPDVLRVESRRCSHCGMLKLNVLATSRRKLDESARDGRTLPCGPECITRRKQLKGQ